MDFTFYAHSDHGEVRVDELPDGEVLLRDATFQLDLVRDVVNVNEYLVFIVETLVDEKGLDVVLRLKIPLQFGQAVVGAHQKQTFLQII